MQVYSVVPWLHPLEEPRIASQISQVRPDTVDPEPVTPSSGRMRVLEEANTKNLPNITMRKKNRKLTQKSDNCRKALQSEITIL
jgi:hypothetical protein